MSLNLVEELIGVSGMEKTLEAALSLSPAEAKLYTSILEAVTKLPNSDPRFALVIGVTWWLVHRRRRLEQQRVRRRQFYRRWRRLLLLRRHIQKSSKNFIPPSSSSTSRSNEVDHIE